MISKTSILMLVVVASLIVTVSAVPAYADQERIDKLQKQIQKHEDRILVLEDKKNSPNPAANLDERIQRLVDKIADKQAIIDRLIDAIPDTSVPETVPDTAIPETPHPTFDITSTYFVDSFSVASQDTTPLGLAFSTNGAKMFVVGNVGDDVNEYTLTTPFDVSTASFVDSFSVTSQDTYPFDLAFSTNGAKMFVVGNVGQDVNEYTLSQPFDVSTASFVDSFSVASQEISPLGLAFSTNGAKMFVVGNVGDDVNEYILTTPFDVSTASFVDSFSVASQDTTPLGLAFSTNGAKMFVVGNVGDDVNEYILTTPFDVSTASFVDSFSVASQDTAPTGLTFSTNGEKMFVVGDDGNDVNEYELTAVSELLPVSKPPVMDGPTTDLEMIQRIQDLNASLNVMAVQINEMISHFAEIRSELMTLTQTASTTPTDPVTTPAPTDPVTTPAPTDPVTTPAPTDPVTTPAPTEVNTLESYLMTDKTHYLTGETVYISGWLNFEEFSSYHSLDGTWISHTYTIIPGISLSGYNENTGQTWPWNSDHFVDNVYPTLGHNYHNEEGSCKMTLSSDVTLYDEFCTLGNLIVYSNGTFTSHFNVDILEYPGVYRLTMGDWEYPPMFKFTSSSFEFTVVP